MIMSSLHPVDRADPCVRLSEVCLGLESRGIPVVAESEKKEGYI